MDTTSRGHSWWAAWRQRRAEQRAELPPQEDPADMGTAFGLDASCERLPGLDGAAQAALGSAPPQRAQAGAVDLESSWAINRLNGRSVL